MWHENSFRRHLIDMHINADADGEFLKYFDPEDYVNDLRRAGVKSAMIYLQSHVGYCYFPTRVGRIHPAFASRPDAMKKLFGSCRREGIDTVAYYSLIFNTLEARVHPDRRLVRRRDAGKDLSRERYLHCCPNNPDYRGFVEAQIEEMLAYVDCDGIFFDMPFWPGVCVCSHCRARWEREHGGEIPECADDDGWKEFVRARLGWLNEFIDLVTRTCRRIKKDLSVEFNLASAAVARSYSSDAEFINSRCDYAGGDLYGGLREHSFSCKLFRSMTRNLPFESMTSRCPALAAHTLSRSRSQLRASLLTVTAHHGANLVIDAIDPAGTMDSRFYDELGTLYAETGRYEKYMKTGEMAADVGVFFCQAGKGVGSGRPSQHYLNTLAAVENLARLHVLHTVITEGSAGDLGRFGAILLSCPENLGSESIKKIRSYIEGGGKVYFSGASQPGLVALLGERIGTTPANYTYIAPAKTELELWGDFNEKYPLPIPSKLPEITTDGEVLATVTLPAGGDLPFASIHSDPPLRRTGIPALVRKKIGEGTLIWCAAPIEAQPYERVRNVFSRYLRELIGRPLLETDAPEQVEAIVFSAENELLASFVYLSDEETFPTVAGFSVSLACPWDVGEVRDISSGRPLAFSCADGRVTFQLDELSLFKMVRVLRRFD